MSNDATTGTSYERVPADKAGNIEFAPGVGFVLTRPGGSFHFDPAVVPPPPPPPPPPAGFAFLPDPDGYTKVLEHNFVALQQLPDTLDDWNYGGRPGGTNNAEWVTGALSLSAEGIDLTMRYNASDDAAGSGGAMEAGAFGTNQSWTPPMRVRVYERDHDANIPGKNEIDLLWTSPWFYEVDGPRENGVASSGAWQQNTTRIHNGSSANVITPMVWDYTPDFLSHCYEVELLEGNINVYYDGRLMGTETLAASDWTAICSQAKWIGIQDEVYSLPANAASLAPSVRSIHGVQVYTTLQG
jgi:hypothetical protein